MQNKTPHIVIVGAGTAGIMLANKLAKKQHKITIIDAAEEHYYQPGFLFVPFGKYRLEQLRKPVAKLISKKVHRIQNKVVALDANKKHLTLDGGQDIEYDILVLATGTRGDISQTEGLNGDGWRKNIFDFYSPDGAEALRSALEKFEGGKVVVQVMDMPIKCPVAPLEFSFLAEDYFKKRGIRDKVELTFVTPLSGAFTKPVASKKLGHTLEDKGIALVTDFYVETVDAANNTLVCFDGRTVPYDLLITIPVNVGADYLQEQSFVNDLGFVKVNHHSLQSEEHPEMFAVGDVADLPTSKAGSVAHFEVDTLVENIENLIAGRNLEESFDGHSNCFVEAGGGKALLLDFNYETQPLEGRFPFAGIGPMRLLNPSRLNHIGKLAFRYIYWYMLLPGRTIPFIPAQMSMKGKKIVKES